MSQDTPINDELSLDDLTIQQARKYAALYRVIVPKDATKEDIIALLKARKNTRDMALLVDEDSTGPKPGWARITIHRDGNMGASNNPVFIGANGYNVTVPRGVEVDVPIKVVSVLNDSVEERLQEVIDTQGNAKWEYKKVMCYPFQVHSVNPGPDPRPGFEKGKAAAMRPREKFRERFGRWPSREELLEAQKHGLIPIDDQLGPAKADKATNAD